VQAGLLDTIADATHVTRPSMVRRARRMALSKLTAMTRIASFARLSPGAFGR
jgi:hypothetical protein